MGRRKDLSSQERQAMAFFLLQNFTDGKLRHGTITAAMAKWGCCRSSVARLWQAAKKEHAQGQLVSVQSKKINKCRRKRVQIDLELIASLELHKRGTIRRLATGINCSKSTVGRWISKGLIRAHSSAIRPDLTAPNKLLRLRFSLEQIVYDRICNVLKFKNMHNVVHIDEKWFYITKANHKFYLTPEETDPHRTCKSKKFIKKVMFSCAVSRPLFNEDGSVLFDGKIGIFPFTEMVPAKRTSKNRLAGTMEEKPIQSITKGVMKDCYISKLIPAIMAKWPQFASKTIYIQQDNARPHILDNDPDWRAAATANGFDIHIVQQPPNSPDTNINDLGWFRAIQSLQVQSVATNEHELVKAVEKSFEELSPHTLNSVFLSLQGCLTEIMKIRGQNCYKLPHMKKGVLARQGALPMALEVPKELVEECIGYLFEKGVVEGIDQLKMQLGLDPSPFEAMEAAFNHLNMIEDASI
ncbi:uncharacterized protein LOC130993059 [Salvia miltiorrhiza]|uniref:uncharacterized protein LOC130993059 n=1 Tax=Salvia miltiorrhiza TaxID=226208 RepID=UPI0025ABFFEB|nr:uncharacterized protein LOC130993059 [Salvia miltiorrhiza]